MADSREDRIRARAHQIWLNEGQPGGGEQRHWLQAANDIDAEDSKSEDDKPAAKKAAAVKKAATPKKPAPGVAKTSGAAPAMAKASKDAKNLQRKLETGIPVRRHSIFT